MFDHSFLLLIIILLFHGAALVGTVVACEGGSDTFAFSTVLPLSKQQVSFNKYLRFQIVVLIMPKAI